MPGEGPMAEAGGTRHVTLMFVEPPPTAAQGVEINPMLIWRNS